MPSQKQHRNIRLALILAALMTLFAAGTAGAQCSTTASSKWLGSPGPGGAEIHTLLTLPKLGQTVRVYVLYMKRQSPLRFVTLVGTKRTAVPFLGGTLYVDPNTIVSHVFGTLKANPSSVPGARADSSFSIPNNPSLCEQVGVFQAGIFDALATNGVVLSNGLELRVGR